MKLERALAVVLVALLLVLVGRALFDWFSPQEEILPVVIDLNQPFYAVYFATSQGEVLEPELRQGVPSVEQIWADLAAGPRLEHLVGVIPPETRLLGYNLRGDTLYLNFSVHLVSNHPRGSTAEIMTVYGIVNSMTEVPGINKVQILVESQLIDTLAGHLNLRRALPRDYQVLGGSLL